MFVCVQAPYLDRGFNLASLLLVAGSTASTRLDFLSLEMDGLALRFLSEKKYKNEEIREENYIFITLTPIITVIGYFSVRANLQL